MRKILIAIVAYLTNLKLALQAKSEAMLMRAALRQPGIASVGMAGVTSKLENIGGVALAVAAVIIGAVVSLILLSTLFPTFKGAVANLSTNVTTGTWGNATADALSTPFAMLIALGGLFAIIALAFAAYKLR